MSSAGINFSGLASGMDTRAVIEALLAVERRPLTALGDKRKGYEKQKSLFGDFETKLNTLEAKAKALKTAGTFLDYKATPEKEDYFTATASNTATAGSYSIEVVDLARAKVSTSAGQADHATTMFGAGGVYITVGSTPKYVDLSNKTLDQIASAINTEAGDSVQASVLDTGNGTNRYQLVLTAKTAGTAGSYSLTAEGSTQLQSLFAGFTTTTPASDAHLKIEGIDVYRTTNQISDAIAGVTLNLKATGPATKLTITTDATAVAKRVKELVDAYNDVVDFVKGQNEQDSKGNAKNPLFGDSTLSTIRSTLRSIVGSTFDTGDQSYSMLAQVGITSDRDGKLTLDETKLTAAITKGEKAVRALFTDATNGIATRLFDRVDKLTSTVDGILLTRKQGFDRLIHDVDDQITQGERRLANYETYLKKKFSAMETMLSRLQGQGSSLNAINR